MGAHHSLSMDPCMEAMMSLAEPWSMAARFCKGRGRSRRTLVRSKTHGYLAIEQRLGNLSGVPLFAAEGMNEHGLTISSQTLRAAEYEVPTRHRRNISWL